MAQKNKSVPTKQKAAPSAKNTTKVTVKQATVKKAPKAASVKPVKVRTDKKPNVLRRIGGYFKGAWTELRQVHWPNRKATWSLTIAVLLYSAFFVALILLLDAFFKYLFEQILK